MEDFRNLWLHRNTTFETITTSEHVSDWHIAYIEQCLNLAMGLLLGIQLLHLRFQGSDGCIVLIVPLFGVLFNQGLDLLIEWCNPGI